MKYSQSIFIAILGLLAGAFLTHTVYEKKTTPVESSTVIVEKIRAICKLATVEAQLSEIYDYKAYEGDYPSLWNKKALVRVRAKVLAGFDLENLNIETNDAARQIIIKNWPSARILSVDHNLDYYDISEGLFASFSQSDHNLIQMHAKAFIEKKAAESSVLKEAELEGQKNLELVRFLVEGMGYALVVEAPAFND